jgi:hypothetical protein
VGEYAFHSPKSECRSSRSAAALPPFSKEANMKLLILAFASSIGF